MFELESSISRNIIKVFQGGYFLFLGFGLESEPGSPKL